MTAAPTDTLEDLDEAPPATFSPKRDASLVPVASIAGRALVTVIAIMTFLASLAAGSAVLVAGASRDWQRAVAREMTIQVRPQAGRDVDAEVAKVVAIARATPGLGEVAAYSEQQGEQLLAPWLGDGLDLRDLPIPRLIVVKLAGGVAPDLGALRKALAERVAGASLDDHRLWQDRLAAMADTAVAGAGFVFLLVLAAMGLAVAFATRGVMAGNREIIGVLHFVGAEDRFVAREFQRHFLRLGLKGGLVGGGCAALAFLAAGAMASAAQATAGGEQIEALFGVLALPPMGYAAIAAVAFGIAFATALVSRAIVFRHLRGLE